MKLAPVGRYTVLNRWLTLILTRSSDLHPSSPSSMHPPAGSKPSTELVGVWRPSTALTQHSPWPCLLSRGAGRSTCNRACAALEITPIGLCMPAVMCCTPRGSLQGALVLQGKGGGGRKLLWKHRPTLSPADRHWPARDCPCLWVLQVRTGITPTLEFT